jgi:hypothetical protein
MLEHGMRGSTDLLRAVPAQKFVRAEVFSRHGRLGSRIFRIHCRARCEVHQLGAITNLDSWTRLGIAQIEMADTTAGKTIAAAKVVQAL